MNFSTHLYIDCIALVGKKRKLAKNSLSYACRQRSCTENKHTRKAFLDQTKGSSHSAARFQWQSEATAEENFILGNT